ncbi:MAG TPA: UDP-N-acetylglucosamine 2-epimerase (non-hydrolyzing) [Acidobacteriaceae bacterium]|nr:UDP-N-acetylglucosamine 2-epimerase (non-hydrolyzing) [Acidobacteriaceae bacterium]
MYILHVVGARPNFMKLAPVELAFKARPKVEQAVVHTGQHYDQNMSGVFFQELGINPPDINLKVGSSSHASQTAEIMTRFEQVVLQRRPDWVVVYGDVNSTVAAALVCAKLEIPVAHVEAGLRSFDRSMPEEINRLLTDQLASLLFTPSEDGNRNLEREGIPRERIHLVGNVMIDTLIRMLPAAKQKISKDLPEEFALVTLHRPSNVDDLSWLQEILSALSNVAIRMPVLFAVHPRTRQRLIDSGFSGNSAPGLRLLEPMPYLEFLGLQTKASLVITDSGGIQEETTFLGIPCLTVRENTERPVTVSIGTNVLVGRSMDRLIGAVNDVLSGRKKKGAGPPLWDDHASERIADILTGNQARESASGAS